MKEEKKGGRHIKRPRPQGFASGGVGDLQPRNVGDTIHNRVAETRALRPARSRGPQTGEFPHLSERG